ncbi:MAG: efflux RND transporter periplasmic adaptor subunit [Verrucomicrobiota bacterium]|nr:efflux RND transporter periplasmic adaptor subunit [Verrucomicrobiota bacterium]
MNPSKLDALKIDRTQKKRPIGSVLTIFIVVGLSLAVAVYYAWPRKADSERFIGAAGKVATPAVTGKEATSIPTTGPKPTLTKQQPATSADSPEFVVSGYIINRERIEVSPRFQGVVEWIKVKKGDLVEQGQVVVQLEASEQRARLAEIEGRIAVAKIALERAQLNHKRAIELAVTEAGTREAVEQRQLDVESARATLLELDGSLQLVRTYLEWTTIRSPIRGVVLEKLVEPGELVVPQSFGGPRGPSTALIAVADPTDLQVELDINENDLPKIFPGRKCKVVPEAFPDKSYDGEVAEIAPEANRQKGTLQVKVRILGPDRYLIPELSARVEFRQ